MLSVGRRPRVRNFPDCSLSAGRAAVELAASAGLVLDDWQADILIDALGERADGKWAAFEVGVVVPRQNGKGAVTEARELAGLFLFGEQLILHSAHEMKTAAEAFRRIEQTIMNCDDFRRRVRRIRRQRGDEGVELTSGARLRFVARSVGSGRGFSGDCNIIDEAYALSADEMAALLPTMSARPNPQLWYTSTPPKQDAALLVAARARGHAGTGRIAWFEWSPPDNFDPADRELWHATNPAMGIRITEEFVEGEFHALPGPEFARERLGQWPSSLGNQWEVFDEVAWEAVQDPDADVLHSPVFCIEVSRDLSTVSIGAAERSPKGHRNLVLVGRFPADTGRVVGWLIKRRDRWNHAQVVIDPGGPAGYLISEVEKHYGEVLKPLGRDVAAACGSVYVGICGPDPEARDVRVRPHPALDAAARAAIWRDRGDAKVFDRRNDDGPDVAPLMAVTLADLAARTVPNVPRSRVY